MMTSVAKFRLCDVTCQKPRGCSKKSVQPCPEASRREGRSLFCARSVLVLREHGKRARTPLAAFFNRPLEYLTFVQRVNQLFFRKLSCVRYAGPQLFLYTERAHTTQIWKKGKNIADGFFNRLNKSVAEYLA